MMKRHQSRLLGFLCLALGVVLLVLLASLVLIQSQPHPPTPVSVAPAAPTNLTASGVVGSTAEIQLNWIQPAGTITGNHVRIYRAGCSDLLTTDAAPPSTSYLVSGLVAFSTYCFTVTANTTGGQGPPSASAEVQGGPTDLALIAVTTHSAEIRWGNPANVTDNHVYLFLQGCLSLIEDYVLTPTTYFNATNLTPSTVYCLGVTDTVRGIQSPDPSVDATTLSLNVSGNGTSIVIYTESPLDFEWLGIGLVVFAAVVALVTVCRGKK
jgi:Fibronectin type III domain